MQSTPLRRSARLAAKKAKSSESAIDVIASKPPTATVDPAPPAELLSTKDPEAESMILCIVHNKIRSAFNRLIHALRKLDPTYTDAEIEGDTKYKYEHIWSSIHILQSIYLPNTESVAVEHQQTLANSNIQLEFIREYIRKWPICDNYVKYLRVLIKSLISMLKIFKV
jgi:type IV secretory pathway VirB4 component